MSSPQDCEGVLSKTFTEESLNFVSMCLSARSIMHWRPLCYKVFFTVFFPKALLLPQGSCERHFSETFSACRTFLPLIRSFRHSKYKSGNMFNWSWEPVLSSYPHQLHHKLYGVAVLSSVHSNAASVKDKHKTQILKSPKWLRASTELPPHDRERTWAVKELLVLVL